MVDVFEGIDPVELEEPLPEPKWRKPVIVIGSILLLLLFVSFSFLDSLIGIAQSEKVEENVLVFPDATVRFINGTLEALQGELIRNEHREIKACLFGVREGSTYRVSRVVFPEIIRANVVHVVSVPCPEGVLFDVHSHPINSCLASEQDVATLERIQRQSPDARMLVMCSLNRFALV